MNEKILADAKILYDFLSGHKVPTEKADFLLVLGSHDLMVPVLAAELFAERLAPIVICSGGFGKITREIWTEEEGKVFAKKCIELGVPKENVFVEDQASNTGENFILSRKVAEARGFDFKSGIIVCKPYMAKRALATGRKQWPEIHWAVAVPKIPFEDYIAKTEIEREINVIVGDLLRMKVYAEKGFQMAVEIPEEVWGAYERLVKAGFNKYVI